MSAVKKNMKLNVRLLKEISIRITVAFFTFVIIVFYNVKSEHQVDRFIEDVFLIRVNEDFDKTILGDIAFKVGDRRRVYTAEYYWSEEDIAYNFGDEKAYEVRPLSQIVDIATWKEVRMSGSIITIFEDAHHVYLLRCTDGSDVIFCHPKSNPSDTSKQKKKEHTGTRK